MTKQLLPALVALAVAALAEGCGPGTGVAVGNAALNTAIGAGASLARRADGDCYAPCDHGTVCNYETGYCDVLPCGEPCDEGERCDTTLVVPRCIVDVDIHTDFSTGE
jgi:hypothetical protein